MTYLLCNILKLYKLYINYLKVIKATPWWVNGTFIIHSFIIYD